MCGAAVGGGLGTGSWLVLVYVLCGESGGAQAYRRWERSGAELGSPTRLLRKGKVDLGVEFVFSGVVSVKCTSCCCLSLGVAGWAATRLKGFGFHRTRCLWIPGKIWGHWEGFGVTENWWGLESYRIDILLQKRTLRPRESRWLVRVLY